MNELGNDAFETLVDLAERYLLGELDAAEFARLEQALTTNDHAAHTLLIYLQQSGMLRVVFHEPRQFTHRIGEVNRDEYLALLNTLSPTQEPDRVHLLGDITPQDPTVTQPHRPLAWRYWPLVASASIAAALALAMTIALFFNGSNTGPGPAITQVQPTPDHATVATLTNTHNASWAEGALAPGSELIPGTRLTLTQGFAEITTNKGAVAILQAPCTVQLIDSPNTLHLLAGKLVGICETDDSKGLLIRTPHMDITDLGTRFGIDTGETTLVNVIQGEVQVASGQGETPINLTAGQAVEFNEQSRTIAFVQPQNDRFVGDWSKAVIVPQLTGEIRFEPSMPSDLRAGASQASDIRVFHERSGVVVQPGVQVNITEPGRYTTRSLPPARDLQGVSVDSFFIHFDGDANAGLLQRSVSITFDRPILGVIVTSKELAASHEPLGLLGVAYGNQSAPINSVIGDGSGLDVSIETPSFDDSAEISEDRRTLTLDLTIQDAIDQLRVLVESDMPD